jgi:hypothetical protein
MPKHQYLQDMPTKLPANGHVIVHNSVRPAERLGERGFRAWTQKPNPVKLKRCDCGWSGLLHFRVRQRPDFRNPKKPGAGLFPAKLK